MSRRRPSISNSSGTRRSSSAARSRGLGGEVVLDVGDQRARRAEQHPGRELQVQLEPRQGARAGPRRGSRGRARHRARPPPWPAPARPSRWPRRSRRGCAGPVRRRPWRRGRVRPPPRHPWPARRAPRSCAAGRRRRWSRAPPSWAAPCASTQARASVSPCWKARPAICDSAIARTHGPASSSTTARARRDVARAASSSPEFSWIWHSHTSAVRATRGSSSFAALREPRCRPRRTSRAAPW